MVESHTISKAHTYTLGEHLLGKIFKMMLENGSDSKSVIYFDRKSPKSYGNTISVKKILIMCRFSSNFHMVKERS